MEDDSNIITHEDRERVICPYCGGTGSHPYLPAWCGECNGSGFVPDAFEV